MFSMKKLGTVVAAVSMLALVGAGSASAANFDPANTTLTAHGTLTLDVIPSGVSMTCTFHSGVRSAGGADAFTTETGGTVPAPPTFSGCSSSTFAITSVRADVPWTLTATSTTAVDVTNLNYTITFDFVGDCTITASAVSLGWTWTQASNTLTPGATNIPITETGAGCPGDTSMRFTGSVVIPGLTIT
jgi:hypothetical protein